MKKRDIVNLIRYHVEGNENAFREEVYGIANEFDASGDNAIYYGFDVRYKYTLYAKF